MSETIEWAATLTFEVHFSDESVEPCKEERRITFREVASTAVYKIDDGSWLSTARRGLCNHALLREDGAFLFEKHEALNYPSDARLRNFTVEWHE